MSLMNITKADMIAQLQKDILPILGFKRTGGYAAFNVLPAVIKNAFPHCEFPLGVVHQLICGTEEEAAATRGFISGILSSLMNDNGVCIWISSSRTIFPPALTSFGIAPDKIIFIDVKKQKEILWVLEEALKCDRLAAVVGEMQELSFTASRRLQLAVEQSRVTGFILCHNPLSVNTTACVTRWKVTSIPSELPATMPGVGYPRWNVDLLKVRNGKPGSWQLEFVAGRFRHISKITIVHQKQERKTG
jgi:protein ImuA